MPKIPKIPKIAKMAKSQSIKPSKKDTESQPGSAVKVKK
jgi:hypothetical protein